MSDKTREQLEEQIRVNELLKKEREVSNVSYAPMIVKVIVFAMTGLILMTVFAALLAKVII